MPADALLTFKHQLELMLEILDQHAVVAFDLCEILQEITVKSFCGLRNNLPNLSQ